eukprot:COSAG01_NODE_2503_length_7555_cov_3.547881_3_plen_116_part_00
MLKKIFLFSLIILSQSIFPYNMDDMDDMSTTFQEGYQGSIYVIGPEIVKISEIMKIKLGINDASHPSRPSQEHNHLNTSYQQKQIQRTAQKANARQAMNVASSLKFSEVSERFNP